MKSVGKKVVVVVVVVVPLVCVRSRGAVEVHIPTSSVWIKSGIHAIFRDKIFNFPENIQFFLKIFDVTLVFLFKHWEK